MLEILDSLIATAAVVLGLSLIVQAIQQIIKQWLDLKSEYMRNELYSLFSDSSRRATLMSGLRRSKALASGISGFTRRITDELEEATRGLGFRDLHLVENLNTSSFVDILKSLPVGKDATLADEFNKAVKDAERWFDMTRQAFQEHYERRMKYWAFGISTFVVLALNANLLDVYQEFSHNKPLREAAVRMGEQLTSTSRDSLIVHLSAGKSDTTFVVAKPDTQIANEISANAASIQNMLDQQSFQIMGWTKTRLEKYAHMTWYVTAVEMLMGWLGMTLLVSLGAPFWYDFLKTVMGVKKWVGEKRS